MTVVALSDAERAHLAEVAEWLEDVEDHLCAHRWPSDLPHAPFTFAEMHALVRRAATA